MKDYQATFITDAVAFPNTGGKNSSDGITPDGTEFVKNFVDDAWGFAQALMDEANLTPNGSSEAAGASQRLDALTALFRQEKRIGIQNNVTDAINDLDFLAGVELATDSPNRPIRLSATMIKQIDANWVAGTNNGGFPSGLTLTNGTWYHVFVIRTAAGVVDAGFDTDLAAANLLADATGYTEYRRVGSIYYVDGTTGINPFRQNGENFTWDAPQIDRAPGTDFTVTTAIPAVLTAPPNVIAKCQLGSVHAATVTQRFITLKSTNQTDAAPSIADYNLYLHNNSGDIVAANTLIEVETDAVSTVNLRINDAGDSVSGSISTQGWIDRRAL